MESERSCPICKKMFPVRAELRSFGPFCSARCRSVDLGEWLSGGYRISRTVEEEDLDSGMVGQEALEDDGDKRHQS